MESSEIVGPISWTGKCEACAIAIASDNVLSMIEHSGPRFNAWRRGMAASVGGVLLDDVQDTG
jgi:hypothetical protein